LSIAIAGWGDFVDTIRFGSIAHISTSQSFRTPGAFGTSFSANSLYDLTTTARGDVLIHQFGTSLNVFGNGLQYNFGTLPMTAFSTGRGADGSQVNYSSRSSEPIQFDAVEGANGLLTVRSIDPLVFGNPDTGRDIVAGHFTSDHSTATDVGLSAGTGQESNPQIAALLRSASTNAMAVWTDTAYPGSSDTEVIGRILDSAGNPIGATFVLSEVGTRAGVQDLVDVAALATGNRFAATWTSGSEMRGRLFGHDGIPLTGEFLIDNSGRTIVESEVISLSGGGFVAVWQDRTGIGGSDDVVRMRVFDNAGNAIGATFTANTGSVQRLDSVVALGDGGYALLFTDSVYGGTFLQLYNASGMSYAGPVQVRAPGELALMADGRLALVTESVTLDPATNFTTQRLYLQYIDTRMSGVTVAGTALDDGYVGSAFNDIFQGFAGADVIAGAEGNDAIDGGDGDDSLNGGSGTDTIIAGIGADIVFGGADGDVILGNDGNDIIFGEDITAGTQAGDDGIDGGAGNDQIFGQGGNDLLLGGDGDDGIDGGDGNDTIVAGAGNDGVYGGEGNDGIDGGDGNDTLFGHGGNDTIFGRGGNDILYGHAGSDILYGDDGGDLIWGGAGDDTLKGGSGSDLFVVQQGEGVDTILDFNANGDRDGIDLRGYFDAIGYGGADPRGAGILSIYQNGADADIYVQGVMILRVVNTYAPALTDDYFLFQ
jgi:Ca2+-binding RTX toxin-like protein